MAMTTPIETTYGTLVDKYGVTLTVKQLAEVMNMSERTTLANLPTFGVKFYKNGRSYAIPSSEVAALVHGERQTSNVSNGHAF